MDGVDESSSSDCRSSCSPSSLLSCGRTTRGVADAAPPQPPPPLRSMLSATAGTLLGCSESVERRITAVLRLHTCTARQQVA